MLDRGVTTLACTRSCEQPTLHQVGGTKDPDIDAILALRPDLVVIDVEENRRDNHDALVAVGLDVHGLHVRSVGDVGPELETLAALLGVACSMPVLPAAATEPRRTAFVPIWKRPRMALGPPTYGTSLLARLGIANVYANDGAYP